MGYTIHVLSVYVVWLYENTLSSKQCFEKYLSILPLSTMYGTWEYKYSNEKK